MRSNPAGVAKSLASSPCVFVSHKHQDVELASTLGQILIRHGLDIWLDVDDPQVQALAAGGDDLALAEEIERGLIHCSHLLAVITPLTVESWWVPFEIGQARARGVALALLHANGLREEVPLPPGLTLTLHGATPQPAYFEMGQQLHDIRALRGWLSSVSGTPVGLSAEDTNALEAFMPRQRRSFIQVR